MPRAQRVSADTRRQYPEPLWWTPTRGARLPAGYSDLADRCDALLLVLPSTAVICGPTAAALWALPLPFDAAGRPLEVNVPADGFHVERPDVRCHRRRLDDDHVTMLGGRRVTTPLRTFVDLGGVLALPDLVAVGDVLLRQALATPGELEYWAHRLRRRRGIRRVREAVDLLDPRSESPRESVLRVHLHLAGLPAPVPQLVVRDRYGRFIARTDLGYEDLRIAIEYDGEYHLSREQQADDARRRLALSLEDWLIVTVVNADVREPERAVSKVRAARLARAHYVVPPHLR